MLKTTSLFAFAASALIVSAVAVANTPGLLGQDNELTRVSCASVMLFVPAQGRSAEDLCQPHGGVAAAGSRPASEGVVVLMRNAPAGGFKGRYEAGS
ncbi:antitermination protein [Microvirga tunisiensis]|uniref:Antitermination protein n=2 Tax=Pannonibacter tanglangensis TaxID=2750084 RepID=A0ABW9ZI15_9HYPH|nr:MULTISPECIES: antitermination protein [unclassified Pannonibacter]NBN63577.1 antitermination protein [Pannonibacter sp. XCT-34]NBN77214.1 antitermination protein [Pannonibacter sp. XCT-53]